MFIIVKLPWAPAHNGDATHLVVEVASLTEESLSECVGDALWREAAHRGVDFDFRARNAALRTIEIRPGGVHD